MKIIFTSLLLSSFFIPAITFAQANLLGDSSTEDSDVTCLRLNNILRYGLRNSNVNGEVSKLQAFLKETGYLSGNTTGFFGSNTRSSVKRLQADILPEVNENDIDSSIVTSAADRHTLATTGFRLSNTGTVGIYTRAKIIYLSCGEIADVAGTVDQGVAGDWNQSSVQSTGISNVSSQAGSVASTIVSGSAPDQNFLEGPSTCTIPTFIASNNTHIDNMSDAGEGKCSITFSWKNSPNGKSRIIYEYDPKNVRASLETSVAGSATIVLDYNSRTATPKLYLSSTKMDIKTFMGVCESGAVKNDIGRCVPASDTSANKCGERNIFWKGNYDSAYTPNNINQSSQLLCVSSVATEKVGYTSTITGTNSGKRADVYTINGYGKADVTCKIDSRDGLPKWFIEPTTKKCKATESLIDTGVETVSY